MEYRFTNDFALSRLDEIISFLMGPRLWIPHGDYPDFLAWADKAHRELRHETKRAVVAFRSNEVVGVAVYQRHKHYRDTLEIKNLTVRPDARGRHIASFLMRNAEIEGAQEFKSMSVVCDAKANNLPIRYFLAKHGYRIAGKHDLYHLNSGNDAIYMKFMPCAI